MLRTNSKKVKEKINNYILESAKYLQTYGYNIKLDTNNLEQVKDTIAKIFIVEHYQGFERKDTIYNNFVSWCQGLPSALNCDYYVHKCIGLVGDILEQTQEERQKYTETDAEKLMTYLLYKSLEKTIVKNIYEERIYSMWTR